MKTYNKILASLFLLCIVATVSCSDFDDLNKDPSAVGIEQVRADYFLNKSIIGAQQDPHIGERMFVLIWKCAARFDRANGFTLGGDNNGWVTDYYSGSYASGWLVNVNLAVSTGEEQISNGSALAYTANVVQMARIWRAYLNAELACGFGPIAVTRAGVTEYESEKEVFYYILEELKDAAAKLDISVKMPDDAGTFDAFYAGDVSKWIKYANSLRMRYAMLLSVVDKDKAKAEFEDAAKGGITTLISTQDDIASVQEQDGWSPLVGVMSRSWDEQAISVTYNNLVVGLGGQEPFSGLSLPSDLTIKDPQQYLGLKLDHHFPTSTNDPCAGYYFDAIPEKIDPRAAKLFNIPGYDDGKIYSEYGADTLATKAKLVPETGVDTIRLTTRGSWSTWVAGAWNEKAALSADLINSNRNYPRLSKVYRGSTNKRVWFGPWETYFLLAEAAVYGWGGNAGTFYEEGVRTSFAYHELTNAGAYLASTDYNRVGTSVSFTHTAEAASFAIGYVNGYTSAAGTTTYNYPKNSIYNGGAVNNDALTKIITQKYLAFMPWQPLEAWNDHRRLGLPFMENQAVEIVYSQNQVPLTPSTAKECKLEFYPKRYRYPAGLPTTNPEGYDKAVQLLGGADKTTTPLWWCLK